MKTIKNNRVNNQIKAKELRVVGESGENLGVMPLESALKEAKDRGLDLIEIAPTAKPSVAKIYNFDKFRYQKKKDERKKGQQKAKEMKHVRITPRVAKNDLETKAKKAKEFMEEGHRLEVSIYLRGREKANKDFAKQKLQDFIDMIGADLSATMKPRWNGRGFVTQISKK